MAINNINSNTTQINIAPSVQSKNTDKLSSGFKVNRDDTAATLSISSKNGKSENIAENQQASLSNVRDIDKVDEMISNAQKSILSQPQDAIDAQANVQSGVVLNLIQ